MKLVEIVGKEMKVWPKEAAWIGQSHDGDIHVNNNDNEFIRHTGKFLTLADDWHVAEINKAQWQAERDRQKGGEWKRHRGGKQPVADDVVVEYKLRSGYTDMWEACKLAWNHTAGAGDIMQYRIISQPQAEEVEVRKFDQDLSMDSPQGKIVHGPISIGETIVADAHPEFNHGATIDALKDMAAEWHQIDGPIKWRDTIIELEAHAEDIQREIASLHNRLTEEGFSLIRQYPSAQQPEFAVDMSDWRNWQKGDIVEVVLKNDADIPVGERCSVTEIERPEYIGGMAVRVKDSRGDESWAEDDEYDGRLVFKFIRRP